MEWGQVCAFSTIGRRGGRSSIGCDFHFDPNKMLNVIDADNLDIAVGHCFEIRRQTCEHEHVESVCGFFFVCVKRKMLLLRME